jgi:hypothetical protein
MSEAKARQFGGLCFCNFDGFPARLKRLRKKA